MTRSARGSGTSVCGQAKKRLSAFKVEPAAPHPGGRTSPQKRASTTHPYRVGSAPVKSSRPSQYDPTARSQRISLASTTRWPRGYLLWPRAGAAWLRTVGLGLPVPVTASALHQAVCISPASVEGPSAATPAAQAAGSGLVSWRDASPTRWHTIPRGGCSQQKAFAVGPPCCLFLQQSRCDACLSPAPPHPWRPLPRSSDCGASI
jgi:hypothetical protein